MRPSASRLAPFSAIELPQLLYLANLPVSWPDFVFELHQELASREFPDKQLVLKTLQLNFSSVQQKESRLLTEVMKAGISELKPSNFIDQTAFTEALDRGRYGGLIKIILEQLLHPFLGGDSSNSNLAPAKVNKRSMVDFSRVVVEKLRPYEPQLLGDRRWLYEQVKTIASTVLAPETAMRSEKPLTLNRLRPIPAVTPKLPSTWSESARSIRHAQVHEKATQISQHRGDNNWADVSPLKMLGYRVDAKDGLSEKDRREFLIDFCEHMMLPLGLPKDYTDPWGNPGTKMRVLRTAKHLSFVRRNFERQDSEKFARAIACWQSDFNFLQSKYVNLQISAIDWAATAKGRS